MRIFLPKETAYRDMNFLPDIPLLIIPALLWFTMYGIYQGIFHLINGISTLRTLT